jgi:hypothetical protein
LRKNIFMNTLTAPKKSYFPFFSFVVFVVLFNFGAITSAAETDSLQKQENKLSLLNLKSNSSYNLENKPLRFLTKDYLSFLTYHIDEGLSTIWSASAINQKNQNTSSVNTKFQAQTKHINSFSTDNAFYFGEVLIGESKIQSAHWAAIGSTSNMTASNFSITGPNASEFSLATNGCINVSADPGCYLYWKFTPTATGTRTANVSFTWTMSDGTFSNVTHGLRGDGIGGPVIISMQRTYPGKFLKGFKENNTFDVKVNWKGITPGKVRFQVNDNAPIDVSANATGASHDFKMDTAFPVRFAPSTIKITPINNDGISGNTKTEEIYVFPYPSWLEAAIAAGGTNPGGPIPFSFSVSGGEVRGNFDFTYPNPPFKGSVNIPDWVPYIGGPFGLKDTAGRFRGYESSNGTGQFSLGGTTGFEAMGSEFAIDVKGGGSFVKKEPAGLTVPDAFFNVDVGQKIVLKKRGLATFTLPSIFERFPVLKQIKEVGEVQGVLDISGKFEAKFKQNPNTGNLDWDESTNRFGAKLSGVLSSKIGDRFNAEVWVAGGGGLTIGTPAPFFRSFDFGGEIGAKVKIDYLLQEAELFNGKTAFNCKQVFSEPEMVCSGGGGAGKNPEANSLTGIKLEVIKNNYRKFGNYDSFKILSKEKNLITDQEKQQSPSMESESSLATNVFPGASPVIQQVSGNNRMLLYVRQNPDLPVLQSTEIAWSFFDGANWTAPSVIANDMRAEMSPVMGVDANGKVIAAWLRIKDPAFSSTISTVEDLPLFYKKFEVVSSVFDPASRTWSAVTPLTDDLALDTSLRLSSDATGKLLLTWQSNPSGEFNADSANPATIKYSFWNGSNWNASGAIADNLSNISEHTAAVKNNNAFIIVPQDPNLGSINDSKLLIYNWNGTSWSLASLFAGGATDNLLPSSVYDSAGQGQIVWLRGADLVQATLSNTTPKTVRSGSTSMAFYNTRLMTNPEGNLTLVWQEMSDKGPANVFSAIYDTSSQSWSDDIRLNEDEWQASDVNGFYGTDGKLQLVYLATEINRVTKTVTIEGQEVEIPNIPESGQTDLRLLEYTLGTDLAVTGADLKLSTNYRVTGESITATLKVNNAGSFPVNNFSVKLYVGNPAAGGSLLGTTRITEQIAAGADKDVTFTFNYPATHQDITAVVDADNEIGESSEFNNTAIIPIPTYSISGQITNNGNPLANVIVSLSGSSASTTTTDTQGNYTFLNLTQGGSYTIIPTLTNFGFTSPSSIFNNLIANQTVNFIAKENCTYSITPSSANVIAGSSDGAIEVTAPQDCEWASATNAEWLLITAGKTGNGNGTLNYSVAANTEISRSAIITIAGKTFTVNQAAAGLSASDTQALTGYLERLSTGWDQPSIDGANSIVIRTQYNETDWKAFFENYFTSHKLTPDLWIYLWYPPFYWFDEQTHYKLQYALTSVSQAKIIALFNNHPNDLGQFLETSPAEREDLISWLRFQWWAVGPKAANQIDQQANFQWIKQLIAIYPNWLGANQVINPTVHPYANYVRMQIHINLRDTLDLTNSTKAEIATILQISGQKLQLWNTHSVLVHDNQFLNTRDLQLIQDLFNAMPAGLTLPGNISVNDALGNTGSRFVYNFSPTSINIFGAHVGQTQENGFPSDVTQYSVDQTTLVLIHEINHVIEYGYQNSSDPIWRNRQTALIQDAGNDRFNYLRSMFPDGTFVQAPQEFFASISNQYVANTALTFELGKKRLEQMGRYQPIEQFLFFMDVYSQGTNVSRGYLFDSNANFSFYNIPLVRDNLGKIKSFTLPSGKFKVDYNSNGHVSAVNLETAYSISGTISYGTTPSGQSTKYVPDVTLTTTGTPQVTAMTDSLGAYLLNGLAAGGYTVTPSKAKQTTNTGISLQDASEAAKIAFNQNPNATTNQRTAADATGNGSVSLQDASEIAKRAFNISSTNIVGQWKFPAAPRSYPNLTSSLTGENYEAILVGDVTGNWTAPANRPQADETANNKESEKLLGINNQLFSLSIENNQKKADQSSKELMGEIPVSLSYVSDISSKSVLIPVMVGDLTNKGVTAYEFTVSYDPNVLQPDLSAYDASGTLTETGGYSVLIDSNQSGRLRIGAFGVTPLSGNGTLIYLKFNVLSRTRTALSLDFKQFIFGEGGKRDPKAVTN